MKPKTLMLIAGEASGDVLAAELILELRRELTDAAAGPTTDYQPLETSLEPLFIGAGGPRMAAVGARLAFDMTEHSVVGISDVFRNLLKFRRLFLQLYKLALDSQPEAIICVDFSGFNRRFAHAVKNCVRRRLGWFHPWNPKIVQYVSPQVWASREGRAYAMAKDFDLLVSIFPFEREWYARRVPGFRVEFVGNPVVDRCLATHGSPPWRRLPVAGSIPSVLLLPGSRRSELQRHLPVLAGALTIMRANLPALRARMILPDESLITQAKALGAPHDIDIQSGGLPQAMRESTMAIASTGTVTMECACYGLPTIALYKTSRTTYLLGKRIVRVKYLAMPNLLAGELVYPEFIQDDATPQNIAAAALEILRDEPRQAKIREKLSHIVAKLGPPGAARRAAQAIVSLLRAG
jgi:lipid-A-disaccharide synthase